MSINPAREAVRPESPWFLVILLIAVGAAWFLSASWVDTRIPEREVDYHAKRGQFGDKFGAVNSLFSGLAFACLVYATFLQRRELALQRQELEYTREELKLTRQETAAQTALFAQQLKTMQDSHLGTEDAIFACRSATRSGKTEVVYHLHNFGAAVHDVFVVYPKTIKLQLRPPEQLLPNTRFDVGFVAEEGLPPLFGFQIKYLTRSGKKRVADFGGSDNGLATLYEMTDA